MGITTSMCTLGMVRRILSARYSPIFMRDSYTDTPSMIESGRAR